MSERYGKCLPCKGRGSILNEECGRCGGTGFSGDATLYRQKEYVSDQQINPIPDADDWRQKNEK